MLTAINLLNYLDRYVVSGALELIKQEFGRSDEQLGVLTSSFLIVYSIAAPFTGFLGDRFPRKWFIGGGVLLWSAATIASGLSQTFEQLLVARALIGIGEAGYAAMAPSFISDLFDQKRRGQVLSLFYAALPVGIAIGYAVGGAIGQAHGWRAAFFVAGAPGILLGIAALFLREPRRGAMDPALAVDVPRPTPREIGLTLLRTRSYVVNTLGTTAMTFAMGGLGAWMPAYLTRTRGLDPAEAGVRFGAVLVVAGFVGTLVGGRLGDWIQVRNKGGYFLSSGIGLALGVPGALAGVLLQNPTLYWVGIFVALFFLFFNTGPLNAALVNVVPASMRASAVAINVLIIHMLGDALSPWLIGRLSDRYSLSMAIVVNIGVIALAAAILLLGAGTLRRDLEARSHAGLAPGVRH